MATLSPMMQQYLAIKNEHKDHILFFRLGDFYEMFFEDAELVSKELDLVLTGKECGLDERAPMCGIPYHASEAYIQKLLEKGYKIAICEQMELPQKGKTLVNRDVIRVVTPATVFESSMLNEEKNNYLASLYLYSNQAALCFCDISTSEIKTTVVSGENFQNDLKSEIFRYAPRELIVNSELLQNKWLTEYLKSKIRCSVELIDNAEYNDFKADEVVNTYFKGKKFSVEMTRCLWQLLDYLLKTQKTGVEKFNNTTEYDKGQYMQLSYTTTANLELFETIRTKDKKGSLLWVLDHTKTSFGKRMLRNILSTPLLDKQKIDNRLNAVEYFYKNPISRIDIQSQLSKIQDIERLCTRAGYGSASPRDIFSLSSSIKYLPPIKEYLSKCEDFLVRELNNNIDTLEDLGNLLDSAINDTPPATLKDGGVIKDGYDGIVDYNRHLVNDSKSILAQIESRLKDETGIPKLKIGYNKVFGYYIEVTNSYLSLVPDTFIRKQTLVGGERYITEELKKLEEDILKANDTLITREREIFSQLLNRINNESERIFKTTKALAMLDVILSFSEISQANNYTKPEISLGDELVIKDGRHPVVEKIFKDEIFIPNDTLLDCDNNRINIITGPNMAGKSTYMRQVAIICLMAQTGCFVPAKCAKIPLIDAIFTRVGASDDLSSGRSTFMVEMSEVSEILDNATSKSLVILDEIGRGTSTFDGMSIAKAVINYIHNKQLIGCKTMFATHYHELTEMEGTKDGIVNYNIAVKKRGDDITFLRKIVRGGADDSYGIQVAKLAGLPDTVIDDAKSILKDLNNNMARQKYAVQQMSFDDQVFEEIDTSYNEKYSSFISELQKIDVNVLTPIEALNYLNKLKNMI